MGTSTPILSQHEARYVDRFRAVRSICPKSAQGRQRYDLAVRYRAARGQKLTVASGGFRVRYGRPDTGIRRRSMFKLFGKAASPASPEPRPKDGAKEPLCLVISPALVAVLLNAEEQKGMPLTEAEVIAIRDSAACIAMPASVAAEVEAKRGYPDIDAENAWVEWQRVRLELGQSR